MAELPTGTITFLFTDIEGSTRLWQEQPAEMHAATLRHDVIIEETSQAHGGVVIHPRGEGDSRFVVFVRATDAVAAVLEIQRAFHLESWPTTTPVRVRMALHTGEARVIEKDYYGPEVNRCARIRAIAHGGQVLLSGATADLVRDDLPERVSLRTLGPHRLRDVATPEQIFQLVHPDLPADFPPLKTLDNIPHNLPLQLASFVGRTKELEEVKRLLERTRLLTLTGPGGIGKTRLALQVGADLASYFADGVFLVSLASIADPSLVIPTIASILGIKEQGAKPLIETLREQLREKEILLLLDNLEQLLPATRDLAALLASCPNLKLLATSRIPLRLRGEQRFELGTLETPKAGEPPEGIGKCEAVRLFVDRAREALWDFRLVEDNAGSVGEICRRLEGIPLAIELAAARIATMTPRGLLDRLSERLKVLTDGAVDLPERQQTMRDTIAWSYDLLSPEEQRLFSSLSVFSGGCTLEAAQEVCNHDLGIEIEEGLASLAVKSLIKVDRQGEQPRYQMLETIREYGAEQLKASGEGDGVGERYVGFFLGLARKAGPYLEGPQQAGWLQRLEDDHDNLRKVLDLAIASGNERVALGICSRISRFWRTRNHLREGRERIRQALGLGGANVSFDRAEALIGASGLAHEMGDLEECRARCEESQAVLQRLLAEGVGEETAVRARLALLPLNLGAVADSTGKREQARQYFEQALLESRKLGIHHGVVLALNCLATQAEDDGEFASALGLYEEALEEARESEDIRKVALTLQGLGSASARLGDHTRARACCEEGLALCAKLGDVRLSAQCLKSLTLSALSQGDHESAGRYLKEGLATSWKVGEKTEIALALEMSAALAVAEGRATGAATLLGADEALRESTGYVLEPQWQSDLNRTVEAVRSCLDEVSLSVAWKTGRNMPLEEAVQFALAELSTISEGST